MSMLMTVIAREETRNENMITEYTKELETLPKGKIMFNKYSVCEYIQDFYEVLHTTGTRYIFNDIDLYIKSRQNV